ncbi:hypothetical protein OC846_002186 [Tilletia horrida]|uniref:PHD-type domain-containing protein n=1 Tax=Tilletia horrida TaxID=155126 RepID=A0AAN6JT59_9BASI|nr:hypothetical protein OC846_002186 [Tilletia horrida]
MAGKRDRPPPDTVSVWQMMRADQTDSNGTSAAPLLHPNAAYATEVLGPPPRLPLDPYYPPLATSYTGLPPPGTQPGSSKAGIAQASSSSSAANAANSRPTNESATAPSAAPAPNSANSIQNATGAGSSSSRSKRPVFTINQGSDIGHGAGPAVLPSAVAHTLAAVTEKKRTKKSQKSLASSTAPRTTRARSLAESASASPSPSMLTIGIPAADSEAGAEASTSVELDTANLPPTGKGAVLGIELGGVDVASDSESIRDSPAPFPTETSASNAAAPEAKRRRITARLSKTSTRTSSPAQAPLQVSGSAHDAREAATQKDATIADDLAAILGARRNDAAFKPSTGTEKGVQADSTREPSSSRSQAAGPGVSSLSSPAPSTSLPSSQDATTAFANGPSSTGPAPSSSAGSTPLKRPRITVKRSGQAAPTLIPSGSSLTPASASTSASSSGSSIAGIITLAESSSESISLPSGEMEGLAAANATVSNSRSVKTSAAAARGQTPPVRAESPASLATTRTRRSAGAPTFAPTLIGPSNRVLSTLNTELTGASSPLRASGSQGDPARASTPVNMISTGAAAGVDPMAYPTIVAAAAAAGHMGGSPQKGPETIGMGMTANGTLARAPAAEFAAAAAAGGHISGVHTPTALISLKNVAAAAPGEKQTNQDFCDACKGHGRFLCCDGCVRSFHFLCISPPLDIDDVVGADDAWYCNICRNAKPAGKEPKGIFPRLVRALEQTNPVQYELPPEIRNYFRGVGTGLDGSYLNLGMIKPLRVNKQGLIEDRDPYKLKDKNGKAVLCFHCGGSALPLVPHSGDLMKASLAKRCPNSPPYGALILTPDGTWRSILSCDFCSAHWHLDCVTPPLAIMPNMTRKWMCPNHAEHSMPRYRVPKSSTAIQPYALPLPNPSNVGNEPGKLYRIRMRNNGDVDIIPDPTDSFFNQDGTSMRANSAGWEELAIGGVNPNGTGQRFRYRIPEKVVRLDFWNRVRSNVEPVAVRFGKPTRETNPVLALDDLAEVATERLKKERLLSCVKNSGTEEDKQTVELVAKVFGYTGNKAIDHPPAKDQREFEEAVERARVHGIVGMEGSILLSKIADAPTVSDRTTVAEVDDQRITPASGQESSPVTVQIQHDVAGPKQSDSETTLPVSNVAMDAHPQRTDFDPTRLAAPLPLTLGTLMSNNAGAGASKKQADDDAASEISSLSSLLSDLSSTDVDLRHGSAAGRRFEPRSSGGRSGGLLESHGLKEADLERLLAIDGLIKVKGEAALLEFLLDRGPSQTRPSESSRPIDEGKHKQP